MNKFLFILFFIFTASLLPIVHIMSSYGYTKKNDILKKHFDNNKQLICTNHIVSKSKGFSIEPIDNGKVFLTNDRYFGDYKLFNNDFSFNMKNCSLF